LFYKVDKGIVMNTANPLALASVSDIKTLVSTGVVAHADAIVRVDLVLARKSLTEGKKARWTRLREWLVREQAQLDCVNS
jgi:hypothetical protein